MNTAQSYQLLFIVCCLANNMVALRSIVSHLFTYLKADFTSLCYYRMMSFVLRHMCFICGPYLAAWGFFIACQSWPRLFPTLSCDPTTVLRQLLGFGECSFLSLQCGVTLACVEKSAPFDGLLAGELNSITETSKMGPFRPQQHWAVASILVVPLYVNGTRMNLMLWCVYEPWLCTN